MIPRSTALPALALLVLALLPAGAAAAPEPRVIADPVHKCIPQTIRCGETIRTSFDATECFIDEESYADFYTFAGPAGQNVTITMTSDNFVPSLLLFSPQPALITSQDASGRSVTIQHTLGSSGAWRIGATTAAAGETGIYELTLQCSTPALPPGPFLTTSEFPDYRFKVRITGRDPIAGAKVQDCIVEALCVSGLIPGQPEVLIRIAGPKPNGFVWPTIVKLSTSQVEVWIQQISTGEIKYYLLPGASPGSSDLPGLFDRSGFRP